MGAARLDDPIKGLDTAIAALNQLIDTDAVAVFFGTIKHQDALKELRLPYIYVGTVTDHQTLNDLYAHASVVLSTSRYETLPGTLIEGMAAGCVPVTFGRGGQGDIVRHGITGYIAKYGDAEDVAEGIRFALSGKVDLGRMRAEIEHKFAAATVARKYIELFEEVMNK